MSIPRELVGPMPQPVFVFEHSANEGTQGVSITRQAAPALDRFDCAVHMRGASISEIRQALRDALEAIDCAEADTPTDTIYHCYDCDREWCIRRHHMGPWHDRDPDSCPECYSKRNVARVADYRNRGEDPPSYLIGDHGNPARSVYWDAFYFVNGDPKTDGTLRP